LENDRTKVVVESQSVEEIVISLNVVTCE
jgi:hypothetical protein